MERKRFLKPFPEALGRVGVQGYREIPRLLVVMQQKSLDRKEVAA